MRLLISKEKKIIFFWTPKAGSTTAKNIFYELIDVEIPREKQECVHEKKFIIKFDKQKENLPTNAKDYLKIQFVRNPYERAVSCFLHSWVHRRDFACGSVKEELNFINYLLNIKNKSIDCKYCEEHSIKQFMTKQFDEIIQIENLDEEIKKINKKHNLKLKNISCKKHSFKNKIENKTMAQKFIKPYKKFLCNKTVKLINDIYEEDFIFFKYKIKKFL
jgi:hypothetical protein